jgi:putative endonuclease
MFISGGVRMVFDRPKDSTPPAAKAARGRAARASGYAAEAEAAALLERKGARIVARNVRCRGGEVDLVIDDGGTLAFVEVRLRKDARFGGAAASVTATKQHRVVLAAQFFLQRQPRLAESPCRFDCVLVRWNG